MVTFHVCLYCADPPLHWLQSVLDLAVRTSR